LALPVVGFVSSQEVLALSPQAVRDAEYARLVAHVERVVAELSARPDKEARPPVVLAQAAPLDQEAAGTRAQAAEYARIVAHVERVTADLSGKPARGDESGPYGADRSPAVLELLRASGGPPETTPSPAAVGIPKAKPVDSAVRAPDDGSPPAVVLAQRASASGATKDDTVDALQRALRERDAVIDDLLRRVEQLERRVVLNAAQLDQAVGGAAPASGSQSQGRDATQSVDVNLPASPPPDPPVEDRGGSSPVQVAQAQDSESPPADEVAAPPPAAPGQLDIDEDSIDRALERTLTQEGVLLLPLGQAEIEPAFRYTRREGKFPTVVDGLFVGDFEAKRNEFETSAALRVGLPFDSQIELTLPYNVVDETITTKVGGIPSSNDSDTGHGVGDLSLGLAKTLVQEDGNWWPDLIARVTWTADTGKNEDNDVVLGGGFNRLGGGLSAVKRQDPLAFVGNVSYAKTFKNNNIEPGDEVAFSLGAVLAASAETSLSFFFNQTFTDDTEVDGEDIGGTDQVIGTFSVGAATTLSSNVLLSVTGEIGLTDDAPDYAIGVALPIRFNLPTF
jgi:hypothetical protein